MTDLAVSSAITRLCDPVDISGHRNNTAISAATETKAGEFNVWGNSFAAEYLPVGESLVHVAGVPFRFPPVCDGPDNVRCAGQFLGVPEGRYDWVHVLAAAERRCEDTVELKGRRLPYRLALIPFNSPWSCLGLSAVSVPCGFVERRM